MTSDPTLTKSAGRERVHLWLGFVGVFLVLGAGVLALYGAWRLLFQLIVLLRSLDPQIAAPTIAASGTILAAVLAVVVGHVYTKRRELEEAHRRKKTDLYKSFVDQTTKVFKEQRKGDKMDPRLESKLVGFFQDWNAELAMWASPEVLKAYRKWNELAALANGTESGGPASARSILAMDDLLRAFRRDIGLRNRGLSRGDLVQAYLKAGEMQKVRERASK